jgi:hypothetical protein
VWDFCCKGGEKMTRICGAEIKSNEVIFAIVEMKEGKRNFIKTSNNKIQFDADNQGRYKSFAEILGEYLKQNSITRLYLKKPMDKGTQKAWPNAFRIEAIINLSAISVKGIHPVTLASFIKKHEMNVTNSEGSLKYQENALWAAIWGLDNDNK